jgi:chromosome segregation protein
MEIADALYGVTMQGDGITQVISQRMHGEDSPKPKKTAAPEPEPQPQA